jgi:hypothetical protein
MIRVVKRGSPRVPGAVRFSIGRASSGAGAGCVPCHALGNPFSLNAYSRDEAIARYRVWLEKKVSERDKEVCAALNTLWQVALKQDVELECFCAPLPCHGDVIKAVVEAKLPSE